MSDSVRDLVMGLLRAIRGDIASLRADVGEPKARVGLVEGQCASISRRLHRLGGDVGQIRRRLELVET